MKKLTGCGAYLLELTYLNPKPDAFIPAKATFRIIRVKISSYIITIFFKPYLPYLKIFLYNAHPVLFRIRQSLEISHSPSCISAHWYTSYTSFFRSAYTY